MVLESPDRRRVSGALHALALLRQRLPRPLVFTDGVFDLLHAGHLFCLEQARAHGAALVVGVHGDASARRLGKGAGRPVVSEDHRVRLVSALAVVDAAVLFDDDLPRALLAALRPEVYVKGGDYREDAPAEAALVSGWGGRTVIVPRLAHLSTSVLVARVRAGAPRDERDEREPAPA